MICLSFSPRQQHCTRGLLLGRTTPASNINFKCSLTSSTWGGGILQKRSLNGGVSRSLRTILCLVSAYATLATGSNWVAVVLRNNTRDWLEIRKGMPVTRMVAANQVPRVIDTISAKRPKEQPTLMEAE